jgi:DNA-binding transcriptional LysR family regulator
MVESNNGVERLDVKLIRYFLVLVEERNVSRAAERLDISQSALSHALGRLRQALGDLLVVRTGGRMEATPRALELVPIAARILRDLDRMVAQPESFDPAIAATRFVMSSTWYFDELLMPLLVERLQREAPRVALETWPPNSERGDEWIENGEIDFRLGWVPEPASELRFQTLYVDRCIGIARLGHPDAAPKLTLERYLRSAHVRLAPARRVNHFVQQALQALGVPAPPTAFVSHNHHAVMETVARTDLMCVLPLRIVQASAARLNLQMMELPFALPEMPVGVYWHERTHALASHRWFRAVLAEVSRRFAEGR